MSLTSETIVTTLFLGNKGPAKFVSPSTLAPVLIAYNAKVRIEGPKGKRELPLEKFFITPKTATNGNTILRPNEIVTEIVLPSAAGWRVAHYEFVRKPLSIGHWRSQLWRLKEQLPRRIRLDSPRICCPSSVDFLRGRKSARRKSGERADCEGCVAKLHSRPQSLCRTMLTKLQLARVALRRAILKAAGGAA